MKKLSLTLITLFLIMDVSFAQNQDVAEKANGPEITFKKDLHDYGQILVNSDGSCTFEFTNTGNEPLILSQPRSSCGCTVPSWPRQPILPGETDKIAVTYNTSKPGPINRTVTIMSNASKNKSVVLRIKGTVVAKPDESLPEKDMGAGAPVNRSN